MMLVMRMINTFGNLDDGHDGDNRSYYLLLL